MAWQTDPEVVRTYNKTLRAQKVLIKAADRRLVLLREAFHEIHPEGKKLSSFWRPPRSYTEFWEAEKATLSAQKRFNEIYDIFKKAAARAGSPEWQSALSESQQRAAARKRVLLKFPKKGKKSHFFNPNVKLDPSQVQFVLGTGQVVNYEAYKRWIRKQTAKKVFHQKAR